MTALTHFGIWALASVRPYVENGGVRLTTAFLQPQVLERVRNMFVI